MVCLFGTIHSINRSSSSRQRHVCALSCVWLIARRWWIFVSIICGDFRGSIMICAHCAFHGKKSLSRHRVATETESPIGIQIDGVCVAARLHLTVWSNHGIDVAWNWIFWEDCDCKCFRRRSEQNVARRLLLKWMKQQSARRKLIVELWGQIVTIVTPSLLMHVRRWVLSDQTSETRTFLVLEWIIRQSTSHRKCKRMMLAL